jgi:hypothetical protein
LLGSFECFIEAAPNFGQGLADAGESKGYEGDQGDCILLHLLELFEDCTGVCALEFAQSATES